MTEETKKSVEESGISTEMDPAEEAVREETAVESERSGAEDVTAAIPEQTGEEEPDSKTRIGELESELAKKHDLYLRVAADMDNLRKRSRRDVEDALTRGRVEVLSEMLPALDSIDMALKSLTPTEESQAIFDGMKMVKKMFFSSMERFGFVEIDALGKPFDPAFHEAVAHVPSEEFDSGRVMDDLRRGYLLKERLVRPSMVVVSSGPPVSTAKSEQPSVSSEEPSGDGESGTDSESTETES